MTDQNVYVYGTIEPEDLEIDVSGVEGAERVYTVTHGGVSALVSDVDTTEPDRTDANVQAHDDVLREVLEYDGGRTVVPMQFGMAFADEETLKNVLRGAAPAFKQALEEVEGTVELGVKVVSEDGASVGVEDAAEAAESLTALSVNYVENSRFSDRLLLNRSYLVERDRMDEFGEAVVELESSLGEVIVQYTGPFAPYNFVDIHVGAEQ